MKIAGAITAGLLLVATIALFSYLDRLSRERKERAAKWRERIIDEEEIRVDEQC